MLQGLCAIYRRELWSLWVTPLAWVLSFVFLLLQGVSFSLMVTHFTNVADLSLDQGPLQVYFSSIFVHISLLSITPALSMRCFAEERKSGTFELLLTAPTTPSAIVLAKFLASFTTFVIIWLPTLLYAVILRDTGTVAWSIVGASYGGVLLIGACYLAVGTLASALTSSQLVALLLTTLVLFGLFLFGLGEYVLDPGPVHAFCSYVSVFSAIDEFSRGIVDLRRLAHFGLLLALSLFFTARIVDSWRTS